MTRRLDIAEDDVEVESKEEAASFGESGPGGVAGSIVSREWRSGPLLLSDQRDRSGVYTPYPSPLFGQKRRSYRPPYHIQISMGSSSSKPAARKLARAPPAWAGARTPNVGEHPHPHARQNPLASETKDESACGLPYGGTFLDHALDITRDSRDPQFLANLTKLGAVTVDHHMQTIRPVCDLIMCTNITMS